MTKTHITKTEFITITYEAEDRKHTLKLPRGTNLPTIVYQFMHILVANGFSRENIIELFKDNDGFIEPPFDWEVY